MVRLTAAEQALLDGREGRLKQVAMENIVRYATILGATELCRVSKATVFCGAHYYLDVIDSDDVEEVFTRMNLARQDEIIPFDCIDSGCAAQTCVSACDGAQYLPFGQSRERFERNQRYLQIAREAGVVVAGTCAPYLNGWLPVQGEHFVTTESGVTMMGNSLFGARCNSDGIEAAFWSAICGRTPKWGMHVKQNRAGTHLVKVEARLASVTDWDILGRTIGLMLPLGAIPVLTGDFGFVELTRLRHFFTTLAISGNCELCHVVGLTPEAPTQELAFQGREPQATLTVCDDDMQDAYAHMCDAGGGAIQTVSLGCPHYDIQQIAAVAAFLRGKKVHPDVNLMVWTVYPIKHMAEVNGYAATIEEAGGHIYTGTCPVTISDDYVKSCGNTVLDSVKQSKSMRNVTQAAIYYGEMRQCLEAAVSGRWEEAYRWRGK